VNAKAVEALRQLKSDDPKAAALAQAIAEYTEGAESRVDVIMLLLSSAAIVFARSINPNSEGELRGTFVKIAEKCLDRAFTDGKN
jgi:hypothetical protein